jgi:hypothetical protein
MTSLIRATFRGPRSENVSTPSELESTTSEHESIPSELSLVHGNLRLTSLWHHRGTIPSEIGNMSRLIRANFTGTALTGTLPTEIGNLRARDLLFFGNQLEVSVP